MGRANPRWPRRSHHDDGIGLTWELKDRAARRASRVLRQAPEGPAGAGGARPLPGLLRPRARRSARADYRRGVRGGAPVAHRQAHHGQPDARVAPVHPGPARGGFMLEPGKTREFERAMGELQRGSVDRQDRGALRADLLVPLGSARALAARAGGGGPAPFARAALERLIGRYLGGAVYSTPALLARLFSVPRAEVDSAVARLRGEGHRVRAPWRSPGGRAAGW